MAIEDVSAPQSGVLCRRRYFLSNLRTLGLQTCRIYVTLAQPRLDTDMGTVRIVRCGSLLGALQHTRLYGSRNLKSGVDDQNEYTELQIQCDKRIRELFESIVI